MEENINKRTIILPTCSITRVCEKNTSGAVKQVIPKKNGRKDEIIYYTSQPPASYETPTLNYNLMPIVLDSNSVPWDIANIYILSKLQSINFPEMSTYAGIADDLSAYRQFLDDRPEINYIDFPQNKLKRPTYRYNGYLKQQLFSGKLEPSTAKRRMSSIVAFYRWMIVERVINLDNDPWQERAYFVSFKNTEGFSVAKPIKTTDLSIKAPKKDIPFEGMIMDGGQLRPLSQQEQLWLLDALKSLGNTELTLIHLVALLTGARIQTVLTLRVRNFQKQYPISVGKISITCGPGSGIDTKGDVIGVLQMPRQLYDLLYIYIRSERAKIRRGRSFAEDESIQYAFLTQQGTPYYQAKAERMKFDPNLKIRHQKKGQGVRQFIKDHVIRYVREKYDPSFQYRFHDLRATFGMNETDKQLVLVEQGRIRLVDARRHVQKLLWHNRSSTTDLYLDYRNQMKMIYSAVDDYEEHIKELISEVKNGSFNG